MNTEQTNEGGSTPEVEQITINPKYKLELVASKNACRPSLENVFVGHSKRFGNVAVATQGRSMAIVPITDHRAEERPMIHPFLVSPLALKESRKVKYLPGNITVNGDIKLADGRAFPLPESDIAYPRWEQVLPEPGKKFTFSVALDAKLLLELAKAIGTEGAVRLDFIDELSPITVTSNHNANGELGVLMPMRIGS